MAYFYGNTISSHWRAYGLYTTSETATAITITLHGGFQSIGWGYDLSGVTCKVTNNGTAKSGTGNVSTGTGSTQNVRLVSDNVVTVAKGTSAKKVTLKVEINRSSASYHAGTSSGSVTVNIPALQPYDVKYYGNGNTGGSTAAQVKYHGQSLTLRSNGFTKTGHSFVKWNTNSSGTGTSYAAGATYTGNAALNLYAVWKANTYSVTPNANGGTLKSGCSALTKTYGVNLTLWAASLNPTRTGYNFLGWATSPTATTPTYAAGASYTANAAATLYAVWGLAYAAPTISSLSVVRSDGTQDDDEGDHLHATFAWAVDTTDSGEVSEIKIGYRPRNTGSYTYATLSASGTSGTVSAILSATFNTATAYDIQVVVTDTHGMTTTKTTPLSPVAYTLDFLAGGDGMAIGKPCTEDGFHVAWDADFDGNIRAPIGGVSTNWISLNGGVAYITSNGNATVVGINIGGGITYGGAAPMKDASDTTAVSKASGTWSSRASITLGAGVWVIIGACQFASNATGRRGINLATTSGSTSTSAAAAAVVAAANGMQTVVSRSWVQTLTGTTTYHMNVYQNSGAALDTYAYLRAVRVA